MVQLHIYRGGSLLGELDLDGRAFEVGDREGDDIRWDLLGLHAEPGYGGRLEFRSGSWRFLPRGATEVQSLGEDGVLHLGDGSLEIHGELEGSLVDVELMPHDEVLPMGVESLPATPGGAGERLRLLSQFLRESATRATIGQVVQEALDQAFHLVNCQRGMVALRDGPDRALRVVAAKGFEAEDPRRELSRRVLEMVLGEGRDVFTGNAPVDIPTVSVNLQAIRAICALPLHLDDQVEGVLYVDRGHAVLPFSEEDLAFLQLLAALVARRLLQARALEAAEGERRRLAGKLATQEAGEDGDLAWGSPAMQKVKRDAERLLRAFQGRSLPVLITGESGTGKEVLSRWLHSHLDGNAGPFVAVHCGAIPKDLAESELFGIEQGVASGVMRRVGRFQQADGGTLFLDEVGEMDLPIQTKLLRALESRRIMRVGGREEIPIDVRIISATNAPLEAMTADGTFREDLFWRLNGVEIRMPPLRERREDIPALCAIFARHFARDFGLETPVFEQDALSRLMAWHWPGNVRELKQRVGALTALAGEGVIREEDLPPQIRAGDASAAARGGGGPASEAAAPLRTLADLERAHVERVLATTGGDASRAADILGIHKKTLRRKLAAWGDEGDAETS